MGYFDAPAPDWPRILALHGKWRGGRPAVSCGDESLTWDEFARSLNRFANALMARGVAPGDRVAILMTSGIPMTQALFGCMTAGCASVPLNLSVSDDALARMIVDAGAKVIVATEDQARRINAIRAHIDCELFITTGTETDEWIDWEALHAGIDDASPDVRIAEDDILNIIYSSGTTGLPKGIAHTFRGRLDWAYDLAIALRYHGGAKTLLTIGLYSNISWVAMLCTLLAGGCLVIHRRFDADAFLDAVEHEHITHTAMVPIQFQRVLERMRNRPVDVSSMQAMMSCGSPLHPSLKQEIFQRFPCGIIELYGLTEGIITIMDPEDAAGRWTSVGRPLLGTDLRVIDIDDNEVLAGEPGEIVSRGRITMPGYLNRPDANAEACWLDSDGNKWLRSGDIGRVDEEGFVYIVDRKKDMILSGGQNVYPQDIEAALLTHPDINDVAVIGVPSARWGETPLAVLVSEPDATLDEQEIVDWCNSRVGKQQRIAGAVIVDSLPRNPNGKILKRELREQYAELNYS
ncbi:MAG TPA: class I adenylate-forming enzyme family protein [Pseudomonadales bacterium]|nr:class I adenylate-forming enzyme family protein [Pseudomonadales bacterium]